MELDLLEAYSIGYNQPHFSWHLWGPSGQVSAGGVDPVLTDISQGWHKYGIWIDTKTITYYMDGAQVFTIANPGGAGLEPFYFMLANGYGGGWTVSLTPSQTYNMHVAYVACWSH
jgi:beta-glucanase (GH16 family)